MTPLDNHGCAYTTPCGLGGGSKCSDVLASDNFPLFKLCGTSISTLKYLRVLIREHSMHIFSVIAMCYLLWK